LTAEEVEMVMNLFIVIMFQWIFVCGILLDNLTSLLHVTKIMEVAQIYVFFLQIILDILVHVQQESSL
jgi:ABC-type multidrug transport system permease subunit